MKKITYNKKNLSGDIFGGITAGIVALPLALAFGMQSGLGAAAGLYGAIALGFFAAILGGTNTQISGPTGPMTVVAATTIMMFVDQKGSIEAALPSVLLTFFLAGAFIVLMGILRIGQYIKYIPYPVISGFMTGIGVIIIVLQIFPMLGHNSPKTIIEIFKNIKQPILNLNIESVLVTAATIIIIYVVPKFTKLIPSTLIALLLLTSVATFFNLNVAVIGDIPKGLPSIHLDIFTHFDDLKLILFSAITLAALGAIDSLLTSVVADNVTKTSHNSNQELIGQGIGNMVSGLFGGIPGAGATMRTLVNIKSGGTTKLSGAIHSILLLIILLALGPIASQIPIPVLAGILITVGIGIIDTKGLKDIFKVSRTDAFVLVIVLILTVFVDLLQAVGVGLIISAIMFMKKIGDITEKDSTSTKHQSESEIKKLLDTFGIPIEYKDTIGVKKINGPLFFGNSEYFVQLSKKVSENIKVLLIDMSQVTYIDQSGLYALENIMLEVEKKGTEVYILQVQNQPEYMMRKIRLIPNVIEEKCLYSDPKKCVEDILNNLKSSSENLSTI